MKMPAVKNQQANGFGKMANGFEEENASKLANKKLDMMERDMNGNSAPEAEVFHDTSAQGAGHTSNRQAGDEPIVIYDTQSNTSIAQTAKDQFAAALLRLQAGLDESTTRLGAMEKRLDEIVNKQRQQQTKSNQEATAAKSHKWFASSGRLNTLMYLSWPVLVFVVMKALEKRAVMKKLA